MIKTWTKRLAEFHTRIWTIITCLMLSFSIGCSDSDIPVEPNKEEQWTVYNVNNSLLPDNQVQAIAIDQNNTKWIGTSNGLARLSGNNWSIFNTTNSGLSSSFITYLTVDRDNNIWIGTDQGISVFDGVHWQNFDAVDGNYVTTMHYDKLRNALWVGIENGLFRYNEKTWTKFDDNTSGLIDAYICSVTTDSNNTVWVGTFDHFNFQGRLWKYDGAVWKSTRLDLKGLSSTFPRALTVDDENVLWMGVSGTISNGLVKIDEDWTILDRSISGYLVGGRSIIASRQSIWLGGGGGVLSYRNGVWKNYTPSNSALPDDYVYSIALDNDQNIWIGTIGGGVAYLALPAN